MHAPHYIAIALLLLQLIVAPILHGRTLKGNGVVKVIDTLVWVLLLWWGGFWSVS